MPHSNPLEHDDPRTELVAPPPSGVVSIFTGSRPLLAVLNRELLSRGAGPVGREELPEIDEMLDDSGDAASQPPARCQRCGGYVCADIQDDRTCLNCGRPVGVGRRLEDLTQKIAADLIEQRQRAASEVL